MVGWPADRDEIYGDVPRHPQLDKLERMREVEEQYGRNPNSVLVRLLDAWYRLIERFRA